MSMIMSPDRAPIGTQAPDKRRNRPAVFAGEKGSKWEQIATMRAIEFQDDYEQPKSEARARTDAVSVPEDDSSPIDSQADRGADAGTGFASEPSADQLRPNASPGRRTTDASSASPTRGFGQGHGDQSLPTNRVGGFSARGRQVSVGFGGTSKPAGGVSKGQLPGFPRGSGPGFGAPGGSLTDWGRRPKAHPLGKDPAATPIQGSLRGVEREGRALSGGSRLAQAPHKQGFNSGRCEAVVMRWTMVPPKKARRRRD
jgi:hypothetical protein